MIDNKLEKLKSELGDIVIIGASKTVPAEIVNEYISSGLENIGENRVQEFLEKYDKLLPVKKHFIGHLQSNKVKFLIGKVDLIHSVHSVSLAETISKLSIDSITNILLQVNIGEEESKTGFKYDEIFELAKTISSLKNIKVLGLMAMLPLTNDENYLISLCEKMKKLFDRLKTEKNCNYEMKYLSMGMSSDYKIAIKHGANMIRLGKALFGERQ